MLVSQNSTARVIEITLDPAKIAAFKDNFRGQLIHPGDADYNQVRRVWNGMIDKHPALIARCSGVADVIAAVNFARENDLLVAVRGGGHNAAGNATCDGGLVIDMSPMKGIQVDPDRQTARAQGGVTWAELDRETQLFGLAAPGGVVSTTGIAGLTLGGGSGWLRRKHGLSCDNLLSVDVVTADGRFIKASETQNTDLFWAVRGGGGNFGVVTSFEYRLHPVGPEVMFLSVMYPADKANELLPIWRDFITTAPNAFSSNALFWTLPAAPILPPEIHNKRVFGITGLYTGDATEGQRLIQPLRELAEPILDLSGIMPYAVVQVLFDAFFPEGQQHYWKSLFLNDLDRQTVETLTNWSIERPSEQTLIDIWAMGGAVRDVPAEATAFGDRSAPFWLIFNTSWTDPQEADRNITWTRAFFQVMQAYSSGGTYLNFPGLMEDQDQQQMVQTSFGANYERLAAVKNRYDPTNLFRLNQNIKPTR